MIKVTALTSGRSVHSRRFRVRYLSAPLFHFGIQVFEYPLRLRKYTPAFSQPIGSLIDGCKSAARIPGLLAAKTSDVTWLERELVPRRVTFEERAGTKRLFDVDDAIWLTSDSGFSEEIAVKSYGVIAGNEFLAEHYRSAGAKTWVVPTSIDTDRWQPITKRDRSWVVGWTGTSSNLAALESLDEPLADFLAQHSDARLLVVCDRKPSFKKISSAHWSFEPWSSEHEVELVQLMDVGLMPLPDTEWSRGKCAFKMLAYMAVGIPAVVSPVGVNKDVLRQAEVGLAAANANDWFESLRLLFNDRERAASFGSEGRKLVEGDYSVRKNAAALAKIFEEAAGR